MKYALYMLIAALALTSCLGANINKLEETLNKVETENLTSNRVENVVEDTNIDATTLSMSDTVVTPTKETLTTIMTTEETLTTLKPLDTVVETTKLGDDVKATTEQADTTTTKDSFKTNDTTDKIESLSDLLNKYFGASGQYYTIENDGTAKLTYNYQYTLCHGYANGLLCNVFYPYNITVSVPIMKWNQTSYSNMNDQNEDNDDEDESGDFENNDEENEEKYEDDKGNVNKHSSLFDLLYNSKNRVNETSTYKTRYPYYYSRYYSYYYPYYYYTWYRK